MEDQLINWVKAQQELIMVLNEKTEAMSKLDDVLDRRLRILENNAVAMGVIIEMLTKRIIPDEEEQQKFMKEAQEEIQKTIEEMEKEVNS